jgi:hypothetical protein
MTTWGGGGGGLYPRGHMYRTNDSNINVDTKVSSHDAFLEKSV